MSADRTSFVISKPLTDAIAAKRMPTSAVQLLHQSSYFKFFQTHLALIFYVRLISFELQKLSNFLGRKSFVELILFFMAKTNDFSVKMANVLPNLYKSVHERSISFVRIVFFYVNQQRHELVQFNIIAVIKDINTVYIFELAKLYFIRFVSFPTVFLQYIQVFSLKSFIFLLISEQSLKLNIQKSLSYDKIFHWPVFNIDSKREIII